MHKNSINYYTILCTIIVILGIIIISGINFYVDPAHLFSGGSYEQGIANILNLGRNVANITNYDERLLQRLYISEISEGKDIIVLGSSRSMQLRGDLFPSKSFFNNSVSGATVEDYLAIYDLYISRGFKPSTVILGLDPWVLNRFNSQSRWKSLEEEYSDFIKVLNNEPGIDIVAKTSLLNTSKYVQLISLAYFKESMRQLTSVKNNHLRNNYYATDIITEDYEGILADGSRIYDKKTRNKSPDEVELMATSYAKQSPVYSLEDFTELDKNSANILEKFVKYLQNNNITVIFFLPPYHPNTYDILAKSDKYAIISKAEEYFKNLASSLGITILGSYDPTKLFCSRDEFYDGMHPKESCIRKIFSAIDTYK